MKKHTLLIILTMIILYSGAAVAQQRMVTGKVTAQDDGTTVPGVNILVKGSTTGTVTDMNGSYSIAAPENSTLVYSFIGFATQEIAVGSRTTIDVQMASDVQTLTEIVVTAFGIEREKKALGYAVQEVKGAELVESRSANVANSLSGRIAGVRVTSNGGPGSGSTVQIRGAGSVNGNNQPLVVIDGVPTEQSNNKQFGSVMSEISPDNIKEISVLKGPSASALYGSRGYNGVILITTKNGAGQKGIGVEVNSNMTFERPLVKPDFQDIYGGGNGYRTWYNDGWSGVISDPLQIDQYRAAYGSAAPLTGTAGTDESWGGPMDGRLVRQWWTGTEVAPLTAEPNNWEQFWETGRTFTNNIAIAGSNDKGNFRLSLGRMDQTGIMAFNDFKRNNIRLNTGYNFTPKLSMSISAEYAKSGSDNRSYTNGQEFIWSHRHTNWDQVKDWRSYTGVHIQRAVAGKPADTDPPNWQHTYFTNPFFLQEKLPYSNEKDRLIGNIGINYKFTDYLSLLMRTGTDYFSDTRINVINFERVRNGNRTPGRYSEEILRSQETNSDVMLRFDKDLSSVFSVNAMVGGLHRTNYYKRNFVNVGEMVVDGLYNLANSVPSLNVTESVIQKREAQSVFGSFQLGYRNAVFMEVTGRNDWSSTLPKAARSYFYPSVSLTASLTDLFDIQNNVLYFAKLRGSWAQVGNDTDPYRLAQTFIASGSYNGSIPKFYENLTINNPNLKPERMTGTEFGVDLRFLQGRLGVDFTYYNQNAEDQILDIEISKASGYNKQIINAGEITNKGVEITLSGTPVKLMNGFTWDVSLNFARNRNKVVALADGLTTYLLATQNGLQSLATVGQPYGSLFGVAFERSPDGQVVYRNGLPVVASQSQILGNIQPDWIGGWQNTFSFKGIVLSTLIDVRKGGDIFDLGTGVARWTGQYEETAVGREEGIIGSGVMNIGTAEAPQYVPNNVVVDATRLYGYNNPRNYHEAGIFDGSYIKLREISIGYQIPSTWLNKLFIQTAKVSAVGRNVAILFKNTTHIDPEVDRFGANGQGFAYGELPSTRSIGFNVSLGF
ncbi:SusC/RagA family TonB-linked outer membrane protein [Rhodocytophaga aerolata]|uniref:SusC/RagA family TonB-linked outer membrane protein n=1 Tax=Rhodocytophaga aerolata TaxID=455078 RepID=A0ABT8RF71_9BACT|nr:SusC/RagA family TonB-linked outer membrane protein [Rhodocytophaga aerolata]MDO1449994.1 SusC/RagA family TonB-linked outer membrane protein [Rhodocytophaga aerolata]